MKICLCLVLAVGFPLSIAASHDLALSVHAEPRVLRAGDHVAFTIRYTNRSNRNLGIIPEGHVYQATDVNLKKATNGGKGIMIPYFTLEYDFAGVARALRTLKPGQMYERRISATVSLTLPRGQKSMHRRGLYVLFSDAAIELPGFGAYTLSAEYAVTDYLKCFLQERNRRRLWVGKVNALPIRVEFRTR
jgi:hypothetical protein